MLEVYGPPVTEVSGEGEILFSSKELLPIEFRCIQLPNAKIYLHAKIKQDEDKNIMNHLINWGQKKTKIEVIRGKLPDGSNLKSIREVNVIKIQNFLPLNDDPIDALFRLQGFSAETSSISSKNISKLRFHVTNLIFMGSDWYEFEGGGFRILPLNVKKKVTIFPREDYKDRESDIKATKLCDVTSYIEIEKGRSTTTDIIDLIENLTLLLSFACGTQIVWISYDELNKNGDVTKSIHRDSITRDYSSLNVIDNRNPNDLKEFIEGSFDKYITLLNDYPLNKIIGTITVAKLGGSFIQLRSLLIASAIDVLTGVWAALNNRVTIIDAEAFKKYLPELRKRIRKLVIDIFGISKKEAKHMQSNSGGLNHYTFESKLINMIKDFSADIESDEAKEFVNSRNSLVHKGDFVNENIRKEFLEIINFADRIILGMLGYKGKYRDCRDLIKGK